jgi:acetyltransferase-like isoleucine patch superfamily enzyme
VFSTIYFFFKSGCLINLKARVQINKKITLGKGTVVKSFAVIQTSGGRISIGKDCAVSSFNHISTGEADVLIGDQVRIGPSVSIIGSNRVFRKKDIPILKQGFTHKGIKIGNDVLIGAGVTILDGCTIGEGAVIGAGSVVTKDVPDFSVVFGVPAQIVFNRS